MLPEEFKIPTRYTLNAGGRLDVSSTGSVYFSLMNMVQSKAMETTVGIGYGILLPNKDDKEINFGMWYRHEDALIPYIRYRVEGFQ